LKKIIKTNTFEKQKDCINSFNNLIKKATLEYGNVIPRGKKLTNLELKQYLEKCEQSGFLSSEEYSNAIKKPNQFF
jgi:predicted HicB family RNase H-like nuclease